MVLDISYLRGSWFVIILQVKLLSPTEHLSIKEKTKNNKTCNPGVGVEDYPAE